MNTPQTPDGWRELLNKVAREPLPEDTDHGNRRRRRARKEARAAQRQRTREAIDAERRREPVTAAGAALIVVVLLAIGAGARWLTDGDDKPAPPAATTVRPSPTQETTTDPTADPSASPSPFGDADLSDPEQVAQDWARAYLTRNPPQDGDHTASVNRASTWMTDALVQNLTEHGDPLFDKLVSRGGVSEVTKVTVGKADSELGTDTPLRIWRKLKVTTAVEGYTDYTDTHTFQVEVTQQTDGTWRVARVLGL